MPQDVGNGSPTNTGITSITVEGYKSISERRTIDVRPLTILAGANSSGKSSMVQPLLLIKQTLEATFDPGPLKLDGPNVRFANAAEMRPRGRDGLGDSLVIAAGSGSYHTSIEYQWASAGVELAEFRSGTSDRCVAIRPTMDEAELRMALAASTTGASPRRATLDRLQIGRHRCVLSLLFAVPDTDGVFVPVSPGPAAALWRIVHVPALRGNPERAYKAAAAGGQYPGEFQEYFAAALHAWQEKHDSRLSEVWRWASRLGLTWKVDARRVSDTSIELLVGRLPKARRGGARDLVNIADVGSGVSQVLPVIVALVAATRGDTVYIEQPEIHLHPRAHDGLARLLADAATRGLRVIAETHSSLLIRAIQTAVAEGAMPREDVVLHWFSRDDDGVTQVTSAELDRAGRFGDWPEDFAEVQLEAAERYVTAAEKAMQEASA